MTAAEMIQSVQTQVADIERIAGTWPEDGSDPEFAHIRQDELVLRVLERIAGDCAEPIAQKLAHEALKVFELEFPRWFS